MLRSLVATSLSTQTGFAPRASRCKAFEAGFQEISKAVREMQLRNSTSGNQASKKSGWLSRPTGKTRGPSPTLLLPSGAVAMSGRVRNSAGTDERSKFSAMTTSTQKGAALERLPAAGAFSASTEPPGLATTGGCAGCIGGAPEGRCCGCTGGCAGGGRVDAGGCSCCCCRGWRSPMARTARTTSTKRGRWSSSGMLTQRSAKLTSSVANGTNQPAVASRL
mmetsp:Transcript_90691/g.180355  ORF Transcript_90691/g.180355 Transcript_90691/m.180355 type:complete len:221 (+) Transcript_90691:552-1214(+)